MIFVLDNYDSFTYNLVQRLGEIDPTLDIHPVTQLQTYNLGCNSRRCALERTAMATGSP